ncbi:hypothetical protein J7F01_26305 [Streptomyces sp. ISL-22]|nr:hypothetical protein [Streptomyces sp. ISL-24]MBT2435617.1 hypothetical protein [Streptomyces sp. ISL-22]
MRRWKDRVRGLTAWTGTLAASLALVVWGASPAPAGGPTSALVVSPGSEETASLHYSDKEYEELQRLLGPLGGGEGTRTKPPEATLEAARRVNVTWLIHDVDPWRVDYVYLATSSRHIWIHTTTKPTGSFDGLWHQAQKPTQLRQLLKELGVMGAPSERTSEMAPAPAPARTGGTSSDTAAPVTPAVGASAARTDDGAGGWWALPGAAAGAALALALRPFVSRIPARLRRRESGPRQELLDV